MRWKQNFIIGGIFLAIQIITIFRNYYSDYLFFFWLCDFIPLLLAVAFFIDNKNLSKALINIGLLAQVIYMILFVYKLSFGLSLMPLASEGVNLFYKVSSIILHSSTAIALILTFKTKPTKKTLLYSLLLLVGVYLMTLLSTAPEQGINYVYSTASLLPFTTPYHVYLWVPIAFIVVVLPTQLIQFLLYKIHNKIKANKRR